MLCCVLATDNASCIVLSFVPSFAMGEGEVFILDHMLRGGAVGGVN